MKRISLSIAVSFIAAATLAFAEKSDTEHCEILTISEVRVLQDDSDGEMKISATGTIQGLGDTDFGRVDTCGRVFDTEDRQIATVEGDGVFGYPEGQMLVGITDDGSLDNGSGVLLRWDEDGRLLRGEEDVGFYLEPPDSEASTTALVVLFLYLYPTSVEIEADS